ncbi:MAG: DUF983 domain-containing protein [Bacteroidetes bacterium]|nr:DUF983 domain-containing protein [Pseudopedobacter sp.]MBU1372412.1 DUF983 domain-containing protein [Bacteroidota bacterium]MBU1483436.1 DUF983 domain-containing protein [Bacteroidota bacterium]MBU1760977.1 DUF983 domain-containing protein [Bacteroidota bacterium]MBU2045319.1 DUF983 domain-containing protein [Bacteroidota bacterium]
MAKTPKAEAMLHAKCPRCRRGDLFQNTMYGFSFQKMFEFCPHCSLRYEVEPGYFYAAMYVGYALNVALGVSVGIATYVFSGELESPWIYIFTILLFSFLLAPVNFRYSRVILLYWLSPKIHYVEHYDHD